ncbi:MAG: cytochrome ubiquinol oxidase subunit I, partial [Halofilum sp. (in: g-proteobacteria)]
GFAWFSLWLRWRGRLYAARGFLRGLTWLIPAPFVAMLAGWFVTEIGRAPWLVQRMMSHTEGVTPSLTGGMALTTLIGYVLVYAVVFPSGIYYMLRIIAHGLEAETSDVEQRHQSFRPVSAAGGPGE